MYAQVSENESDELITRHAPLVKRIAYHLMGRLPSSVQVEDLIQAGMIGLLEALKHFDPTHGASFETYAGIRIRGAMLDEIRTGDWTPRSVHRNVRELSAAVLKVENRKGGDATGSEVAAEMGISLDDYHAILQKSAAAKLFNLDEANADQGYEHTPPSPEDGPEERFHKEAFAKALASTIDQLPERERLVMSLYYGDELNLAEIGVILKVSESRVCQIHGQALARVRARMSEWTSDGNDQN